MSCYTLSYLAAHLNFCPALWSGEAWLMRAQTKIDKSDSKYAEKIIFGGLHTLYPDAPDGMSFTDPCGKEPMENIQKNLGWCLDKPWIHHIQNKPIRTLIAS